MFGVCCNASSFISSSTIRRFSFRSARANSASPFGNAPCVHNSTENAMHHDIDGLVFGDSGRFVLLSESIFSVKMLGSMRYWRYMIGINIEKSMIDFLIDHASRCCQSYLENYCLLCCPLLLQKFLYAIFTPFCRTNT